MGGGIYLSSSSPSITNCIIAKNSVGYHSGGMCCSYSSPVVANCTFADNTARYFASGIYCIHAGGHYSPPCAPSIRNCIFWDASPDEIRKDGHSSASFSYCNIRGGYPGTGNISSYPSFVNPTMGDYHLLPNSPCIDAGIDSNDPNTDKDGISRPQDGDDDGEAKYDMGAYEYVYIEVTSLVENQTVYLIAPLTMEQLTLKNSRLYISEKATIDNLILTENSIIYPMVRQSGIHLEIKKDLIIHAGCIIDASGVLTKDDVEDSLVAHYPFNGNAIDESGNGNHGTIYGATLTEDRFGNPLSAYSFDGVNDYVNIPSNKIFDIGVGFTVSAWFKKGKSTAGAAGIISRKSFWSSNEN